MEEFEFEIQVLFWIRLLDFRDLVEFSDVNGLLDFTRKEEEENVREEEEDQYGQWGRVCCLLMVLVSGFVEKEEEAYRNGVGFGCLGIAVYCMLGWKLY
ncbi:hypothetical protein KY290_016456 [Solanum tuberosum]|uniref:Uncharacterized protein n=1 Tax=Solanum tuberosum TaxID=4113 RepID=A0ABQ7V8H1_SOLTU|nr:hypothetical protein KY290_016456 [Solanum tuberosum]